MLSEVEARSSRGSLLTLPLADVSDGIIITNIDGLDPVKATIVTSSSANMDGTQYHTAVSDDRNIKLQVSMEPDDYTTQSVASIRKKLYEFFMPKSAVGFTFQTEEGLEVITSGRVESFENAHFTKEPAVDISIICFDPDFIDPVPVVLTGSTVSDASTFDIDYHGSVETGIRFELLLNRDLTEFTLYSTMPDGTIRNIDFAAPLLNLDTLVIETTPGQKSVTQYRDGNLFANPLYGISPQSFWTELQPGVNTFRIYAEGAPLNYNLSYYVRYGGL